ncbi:MAG TPA: ester cyclase [Flavipsychrobacter sp.]|nr:ester cyclase [Flavipsychrobacter sp.]
MENKQDTFIWKFVQEVWNKGDEKAIDEMMHPDCIVRGLGPMDLVGPEQFKPFFFTFINDFSEIQLIVEDVIVEGEKQVSRCVARGRHNSTGHQVDFTGISIFRVVDNKLAEAWNNYDFARMIQQITGDKE